MPKETVPNPHNGLLIRNWTDPTKSNPTLAMLPIFVPILSTAGEGVRRVFDFSISDCVNAVVLAVAFHVRSRTERVKSDGIFEFFLMTELFFSWFIVLPPWIIENNAAVKLVRNLKCKHIKPTVGFYFD